MRVLTLLPTYNEIATVERAVQNALGADMRVDVLVIDDNSTDGTGAVVDRLAGETTRVEVLHRDRKSGLGSAYRAGLAWALARGYDAVIEMDADLSHPADRIPLMLAELEKGADLVLGSRYVPGGRVEGWPLYRHILSRGGNLYVRALTRVPVADVTAGFRAYSRRAVERFALAGTCEGYACHIELTLECWKGGLTVREVPIVFTERVEGASKMTTRIMREAATFVYRWSRKPTSSVAPVAPGRTLSSPAESSSPPSPPQAVPPVTTSARAVKTNAEHSSS